MAYCRRGLRKPQGRAWGRDVRVGDVINCAEVGLLGVPAEVAYFGRLP
jgi:hypothetical protein